MKKWIDSSTFAEYKRSVHGELAGEIFAGADLQGFDFSQCKLSGANFRGANLTASNFFDTELSDAVFTDAKIHRACFAFSKGNNVDFSRVEAIAADFSMAEYKNARFFGANLERANFTQSIIPESDFTDSELTMTLFSNADLSRSILSAEFSQTIFVGIDLSSIYGLESAVIDQLYADTRTLSLLDKASKEGKDVIAATRLLTEGGVETALPVLEAKHSSEAERGLLAAMPEYVVSPHVGTNDVIAYTRVLADAEDERPLQAFLEAHHALLLRPLAAHHRGWVIPQPRLGGDYVPDFLACGLSSVGLSWLAIEIESPTAKLFSKNGDPSAVLNHAVHQIRQWRTWLSNNLSTARNPKQHNGLGLIDIYAELPGLILIGRSSDELEQFASWRVRMSRESNIEIRTYDYLFSSTERQLPESRFLRRRDA